METKNKRKIAEMIQDEKWNSKMAALEAAWRTTIADTQEEYQKDRAELSEQRQSPGSVRPRLS